MNEREKRIAERMIDGIKLDLIHLKDGVIDLETATYSIRKTVQRYYLMEKYGKADPDYIKGEKKCQR